MKPLCYTYDEQGRMLSKIEPDGKQISYSCNALTGKVASVTTPAGTTQYRYNSLGQLCKAIAAEGETTYEYNAIGNLKTKRLPNGIIESYTYDSLNRLHILEQTNAAGVVASYTYTYDSVGNKTKVEELGSRSVSYTYDALYRLTKEAIVDPVRGNRTIEYVYDAVGNRLTKKDSAIGETVYRYNQNDWLLDEKMNGMTTSYTYDANGNTKTKTTGAESTSYVWDTQNRLTNATIVKNGQTQQLGYEYNVEGMRTKSIVDGVETRYLLDENRQYAQVLEEYDATGVRSRYVYGSALDLIAQTRGEATSFYLEDGHSGVRQLTNAGGAVTDQYGYDAYGNVIYSTGSTQNAYQYRGEQTDPNLGMQYLRARYYNQNALCFASVDPFEGWQASPISRHRYIYAHSNPIYFVDPTGKFATTMSEVSTIFQIISVLTTDAIAQAATGQILRTVSGDIEWSGDLSSIDANLKLLGLGINGSFGLLDLTTEAPERSGSYPGITTRFRGTWLQVIGGISADVTEAFDPSGGLEVPLELNYKLPVNAVSPRILTAAPIAFQGSSIYGSVSSGSTTGKFFTAGFGRGTIYSAEEGAPDFNAGIGVQEGLSIAMTFFPSDRHPRLPGLD